MDNVVEFINSFNPKCVSREDISGRLEKIHKTDELILPSSKGYFNIVDITTPADFFVRERLDKKRSLFTKSILSQGSKIHRIAESWLKQHEEYFGSEFVLDGYFIGISARGKPDGKISESIIEIKSIKELPENVEEIIEKYAQYLEQLAFYSIIDPLSPNENYLVFITRDYPYKIKSFKVSISDLEKIKKILKRRIHLMKEVSEGKENIEVFGKCRYCNGETCNIKEKCPLFNLPPLKCEVKDFLSIVESPEFTTEVEKLKKEYGESFEFYSAYNILHPRKFCLNKISEKEDVFQTKHSTEKTYFGNLVYNYIRENKFFADKSEIKESAFKEFKLNKAHWFLDKSSLTPEGKITPFITHVSDYQNFDKPHPYKMAELGIYLMVHKLERGMIFQYFPIKNKVKAFEITFDFHGDYIIELKKIIEGLKTPENFKSLPKCSFGCKDCVYEEECLGE